MNQIDKILCEAVEKNRVPFVVAMAAHFDGTIYSGAAGDAAPGMPAVEDTVFRLFSMTKAIGSLAAMILIDQGKLTANTAVADILPEWNALRVLEGFDGKTPQLRAPTTEATIRHLATHTSGLEYEFWNAEISKYVEVCGHPSIQSGLLDSLNYPLSTDPGTRWGYGPSTDWLGRVVEAIDGRSIDVFCHEEIFEPLGMTSAAFEPDGLEDRLGCVSIRGEDGCFEPVELAPPSQPEFYGMGQAMYASAPDYLRFLRMILNKGQLDGNRILSESAVMQMITDHMDGLKFQTMKSNSPLTADVTMLEGTVHSFGFLMNTRALPGKRSAGSQSWAGICNTHYWIDPAKDVAAVIMTQSLPFVEPPFMATYDEYERAVYASL